MKKVFIAAVCLFFIFFLDFALSFASGDATDTAQNQKKSVVTVYVDNKKGEHLYSGSGLIIDQNGVVATSCRVILKWFEGGDNIIFVRTEDGYYFPIEQLISNNCDNNIALIKVKATDLPAASLDSSYKPKRGEGITVIDRASGSEPSMTEGVIKDVRNNDGIFQIAPVSPQPDGSSVLNRKGEIIGISTLLPKKKENLPVVIPAKHIAREFKKYKNPVEKFSAELSSPSPAAPPERIPAPAPLEKAGENSAGLIQNDPEKEFLRGRSYDKSNLQKDAVEAYRHAIELKPDYFEAYVNIGLDYYRLGRYSEAADAYEKAIKIKPDSHSAYSKLGAAYIILGNYSLALDAFRQALKIDPGNSGTHYDLGVASIIAGDKNGAIEEYTVLKELDKNLAEKLLDLIY